jgi:hypothetical protein
MAALNARDRWRRLSVQPWMLPLTERRIYSLWALRGRCVPAPPIVKQRIVRRCQPAGIRTFVETGTHTGEMVAALLPRFDRLVSIELHPALAAAARRRFATHDKVEILEGDSATLFRRVLSGITVPALCWLDAHFTGGTSGGAGREAPILSEIEAVLEHPVHGHVVLVDDARCFTGRDGFPTLQAVRQRCAVRGGRFEVADDIIRWYA